MMLGFIGLGGMAGRMARRLMHGGYALGLYNRTTEKTRGLAESGARVFESPAKLARNADLVLTMLADDAGSSKSCSDPKAWWVRRGPAR